MNRNKNNHVVIKEISSVCAFVAFIDLLFFSDVLKSSFKTTDATYDQATLSVIC